MFSCPAQPIATRPIETSAGVFAAASRAKGNARIVETRQDWRGGGAIAGAELPSLAEGRGPLIDLCLAGNEFFYFVRTDARKNAKEKTPKKKGGGTPGDANHHPPHREMRPRALVVSRPACARPGPGGAHAFRRSTAALAEGTFVAPAQRQARLPGTWPERSILNARSNRGAETLRLCRALPGPHLSQSSGSTPRAGRCAGRHDAQAARERAVSSRPRAPHSLRFREYPRPKASFGERDSSCDVSEMVTIVKYRRRIGERSVL